jgi:hypothetical protein
MAPLSATGRSIALALILAIAAPAVAADDLQDFADAVERAELQYRFALHTLESSGREQTATEVRHFREALQDVIARLESNRPAQFEGDDSYAATMMQIDTAIVGALIVINIGGRETARAALAPIGETLAKLRERVEQR